MIVLYQFLFQLMVPPLGSLFFLQIKIIVGFPTQLMIVETLTITIYSFFFLLACNLSINGFDTIYVWVFYVGNDSLFKFE